MTHIHDYDEDLYSSLLAFTCLDCKDNTFIKQEYYMLHDHVWLSAAGKYEMLCISCFEKRLGRVLISKDFVNMPINFGSMFPQSDLLCSRIYG